jgi:hypothetical protein
MMRDEIDRLEQSRAGHEMLRRSIDCEAEALLLVLDLLDAHGEAAFRKDDPDAADLIRRALELRELGDTACRAARHADRKAAFGVADDRN